MIGVFSMRFRDASMEALLTVKRIGILPTVRNYFLILFPVNRVIVPDLAQTYVVTSFAGELFGEQRSITTVHDLFPDKRILRVFQFRKNRCSVRLYPPAAWLRAHQWPL